MAHAQAKRVQELERLKRQKAAQEQAANPQGDGSSGKSLLEDENMAESQGAQEQNPEAAVVKTEQVEAKAETAAAVPQQAEETSRGPETQNATDQKANEVTDVSGGPDSAQGQAQTEGSQPAAEQATPANATDEAKAAEQPPPSSQPSAQPSFQLPRQPQEYVDDTLNILKTAFPLLALSMEKMVDHINVRSRAPPEEDVYRFFSALLTDALSVSTNRGRTRNKLIPFVNSNGPKRLAFPMMTNRYRGRSEKRFMCPWSTSGTMSR